MQAPCLLGFWDVITSNLMGLFPTVNKALKHTSSLLCKILDWFFQWSGLLLGISPLCCQIIRS